MFQYIHVGALFAVCHVVVRQEWLGDVYHSIVGGAPGGYCNVVPCIQLRHCVYRYSKSGYGRTSASDRRSCCYCSLFCLDGRSDFDREGRRARSAAIYLHLLNRRWDCPGFWAEASWHGIGNSRLELWQACGCHIIGRQSQSSTRVSFP